MTRTTFEAKPNARTPDTSENMQAPDHTSTDAAPHSVGAAPHRKLKADIAVIGAGSGGLSVAAGAAMLGLNVVLYEKAEMGGDCLNHGCVPSKALLSVAKAAQSAREAGRMGVEVSAPKTDWEKVRQYVQSVIGTIAPVDSQERFEGLGVTVIREAAKFADEKTIVSATTSTTARRIVIATGSRAFVPPIEGLATMPYLTNETIFTVPEQPEHLIILGAGPIGMEMAQAFNRLGTRVTVIEKGRALARADSTHAALAVEKLEAEGVCFLQGHGATKVTGTEGDISVTAEKDGETVEVRGSHVLVALGRRAVLDGLNLEAGLVNHDKNGIFTRGNLRSSSNARVWAVGDVAGEGQFTHLAGWHASVFVRNALFKSRTRADALPVPAVTYTSPEVAQVGLTEAEARQKYGDNVRIGHFAFDENDRAIAEGKPSGEAKLIIRKGKLIGASIIGEGAGDVLQTVTYAMSNGQDVKSLTNFIPAYPTRGEIVKRAASAHFQPLVFGRKAQTLVSLLQRIP